MGMGQFSYQLVGAKEAELEGYPGGEPPSLFLAVGSAVEVRKKVFVPEACDGEFTPADRPDQFLVVGCPWSQGADVPAMPGDAFGERSDEVLEGLVDAQRSQGFKIALIAGLADPGPLVEVGNTLAHPLPAFGTSRSSFFRSEDLEVSRLVERCFHPEYRTLLIVHLDGIGLDLMFDAYPLRSLLIGTDNLSREWAIQFLAEEAHYVDAGKGADATSYEGGIDGLKVAARPEHDVRRPLALIGGPVVVDGVGIQELLVDGVKSAGDALEDGGPVGSSMSACALCTFSIQTKQLSRRS